ncbi:MAG: enoyl-CoA hydratase-related protein [Christensenella sp.]|nr:enoyl-CoA hydratase-related protein [Christensenella sp.]
MQNILVERYGSIAVLTVNRPRALNALNTETLTELEHALREIEADDSARVLIVTGTGQKAFIAGADIGEMADLDAKGAKRFAAVAHRAFNALDDLRVPTIAAINGYALGGGLELALCCDIRLAAEGAKVGQPEVTLGITPGFGGTQRLARLVGAGMAKQMIYTARNIKAEEACRIGLVNAVYPLEELYAAAEKMARQIAANAPIAVRASKKAINEGLQVDIDSAVAIEEGCFGSCFGTADQREGMTAFLEKRKHEPFTNC